MEEKLKRILKMDLSNKDDAFIFFLTLFEYFFSVVIGTCICFLFTFANNCTLFEIYQNFYYACYFAFFFFIIGFTVLSKSYRSYLTKFQHPDFIKISKNESFRFKYISILGLFLIFSSLFSLLVHAKIIRKAHYIFRVPLFCVIG
ncbi:MAG: hypothetical protein MJ252_31105, partial [archaeon]|nr:hypothetical protein [archaeon]